MTGIFVSFLVSVLFASSVGAIANKDLERYFKDMRKDVMQKLDGLEKSNKDLLNKLQEVEDAVAHEAETHSNKETSFPSNQALVMKKKSWKTKNQFVKSPTSVGKSRVFRMMTSRKGNGGGESETPHHENATSLQSLQTRKNQFVKSPTSGGKSRVFRMMTSRKGNGQFVKSQTSAEMGKVLLRMKSWGRRKGNGGGESETPHHENASSRQPLRTRKTNNQFVKSPTSVGKSRVFRMMTSRKGNGGGESETPHHENATSLQSLQTRKSQFVKSPTAAEMGRVLFGMMTSQKGGGESKTAHHENASSRQQLRTRKSQFVKSPTAAEMGRVLFGMMTSRKGNGGGESETPHHENGSSRQQLRTRKSQFVKSPMSPEMGRVLFGMMTSRKGNGGGESKTAHHENASSRQPLRTRKSQFVKSPMSPEMGRVFFGMMTSRKGNGNHGMQARSLAGGPVPRSEGTL